MKDDALFAAQAEFDEPMNRKVRARVGDTGRWRGLLPALAAVASVALAGCSDIVPGLNISEGSASGHEYHIVNKPDEPGYAVEPGSAHQDYIIVPLTPENLGQVGAPQAVGASSGSPSPLKALLPSDVPPEYQLGPGDIVYVTVWDHPELTSPDGGQLRDPAFEGRLIAADGSMFYPFVGRFHVGGMTAPQLGAYISSEIRRVIQNPQVDVRIVSYRANRIQVTGEVKVPGTLTLDDTPKGVIQAIDASGGLTDLASRRRVLLVRKGHAYAIDLADLLSGSRPVANPALEPGDVLHVPDQSGDQVYVLGSVQKQVPIPMGQAPLSIINALSQAGGLDNLRAKDSGVLVFRMPAPDEGAETKAVVFTLDLSNPQGVLIASQFQLQPRDVVYVKATAFAKYNSVVTELLPTITSIFQTTGTIYQLQHIQ